MIMDALISETCALSMFCIQCLDSYWMYPVFSITSLASSDGRGSPPDGPVGVGVSFGTPPLPRSHTRHPHPGSPPHWQRGAPPTAVRWGEGSSSMYLFSFFSLKTPQCLTFIKYFLNRMMIDLGVLSSSPLFLHFLLCPELLLLFSSLYVYRCSFPWSAPAIFPHWSHVSSASATGHAAGAKRRAADPETGPGTTVDPSPSPPLPHPGRVLQVQTLHAQC